MTPPPRRAKWTDADARACRAKCKRCDSPIVWAEVESTVGKCNDKRKWFKLDPDLTFHGCNYGPEQHAGTSVDQHDRGERAA